MRFISKPIGWMIGIKLGFKYAFNGAARYGVFKDAEDQTYITGALLMRLMSDGEKSVLGKLTGSKKLQEKMNAIAAKAFEQSKDFSGNLKLKLPSYI